MDEIRKAIQKAQQQVKMNIVRSFKKGSWVTHQGGKVLLDDNMKKIEKK